MTPFQKGLYSVVALAATNSAAFAVNFGDRKVSIIGPELNTAESAVQIRINTVMICISVLVIGYGIWGGFQIITAGGDEKKVKKGRTILIQAVVAFIIIGLVGLVVKGVVSLVVGQ